MECLDEATVLAHCAGSLAPDVSLRVRTHLTTCEECLAVVRTFARASSPALDGLAPDPPPPSSSGPRPSYKPARGDILVGRYVVDRVLPPGDGVVTALARDAQSDREVSVTILGETARRAPGESERFLRAARRAMRIKSERAERVLDAGTLEDGGPYVVRERIPGLSSAAMVAAGGALPDARAVDLVIEAAEPVAEAHTHGVVHGALAPTAIYVELLDGDGERVKLRGFGRPRAPEWSAAAQRADVDALRATLSFLRGGEEPPADQPAVLAFVEAIAPRASDRGRSVVRRIAELVARNGEDLSIPPPRDRTAFAVPRAPRVPADAADVTLAPSPMAGADRTSTTRRFGVALACAAVLAVLAAYALTRIFPELAG